MRNTDILPEVENPQRNPVTFPQEMATARIKLNSGRSDAGVIVRLLRQVGMTGNWHCRVYGSSETTLCRPDELEPWWWP